MQSVTQRVGAIHGEATGLVQRRCGNVAQLAFHVFEHTSQPLTRLWMSGRAPAYLKAVLGVVRMMGARPVSSGLRMAWNDGVEMRATLGQLDA